MNDQTGDEPNEEPSKQLRSLRRGEAWGIAITTVIGVIGGGFIVQRLLLTFFPDGFFMSFLPYAVLLCIAMPLVRREIRKRTGQDNLPGWFDWLWHLIP